MRTIIVNEKYLNKKALRESILKNELPDDILHAIDRGKTSLGRNPAIPNIHDDRFLEDITISRFEEAKENLKHIGEIDDFSDTNPYTMLEKLINKCQELERPNRNLLEKLCSNIIVEAFQIPEDTLEITLNLVDEIPENQVNIDPDSGSEVIYDELNTLQDEENEVYKRKFINCLIMGGSLRISSDLKYFLQEVYKINPKLPELYSKIIYLNDYLLFEKENLNISKGNEQTSAFCNLQLGNSDKLSKLTVYGKIFPLLLSESIRGCFELFTSNGIPGDLKSMATILKKSDYLKAEPWNMRIGPALWDIIMDLADIEDPTILPYFMAKISLLKPEKFNKLMNEVLARTEKGRFALMRLVKSAQKDKKYGDFENKMRLMNLDVSLLTDDSEYLSPDEL